MNKIETAKIVTIVAMVAAVGAVTILASTSLVQQASAQEEPKVGVVHRPPGNPDKSKVICVDLSSALEHQQEHGDFILGPCLRVIPE
jgi:hypothetical protein